VQKFKEPKTDVKWQKSLTRSSAVAKRRSRDDLRRWKLCCHSKSLKIIRIYTVN